MDNEKERRRLLEYRQVVYTGERILPDKGFRIYMGNYHYSRDMYAYLFGCGHRRVLSMMVNNASERMYRARIEAYANVCQEYDVPCQPEMVYRMVDPTITTRQKLQTTYDAFRAPAPPLFLWTAPSLPTASSPFFPAMAWRLCGDYSLTAVERGKVKGQGDPLSHPSVCRISNTACAAPA